MIRYACSALLVLSLSACQTVPLQRPASDFDFGEPPNYSETELKNFVGVGLKDEESARFRFREPQKAYCNTGALSGGKLVWTGWVIPFELNARNSYGAYTGYTLQYARYEGIKILDVSDKDTIGPRAFTPQMGVGCSFTN